MKTSELKTALHETIENINDAELLEAIYKIVSSKSYDPVYSVSDKDWAEIERRQKLHKNGKSKSYNWEEAKTLLNQRLKK